MKNRAASGISEPNKLSNINASGILAEATGRSLPEIGTTTFRPFYTPVSFGALTGAFRGTHYQPVRRTPLHAWCEEMEAVFAGKKDAQTALNDAVKRGDEILRKFESANK